MRRHSLRSIFLFWVPLAATWVMMATEGPFLAAVIARLADPTFNLAAHGVAFAFAILVESPVIMLMSASTALVEDRDSLHKMRRFTWALNAGSTALLLLVLVPPVYGAIMDTLLGLPDEVGRITYGALWLFLPWPAAIGYRRFLHGLLIRSGRTRLVAVGTVLRLAGMAGAALLLYFRFDLPGAWVGAAALSTGVMVEALAARVMAREVVAELEATGGPADDVEDAAGEAMDGSDVAAPADESMADPAVGALGYREIVRFYYPLALTSLIGLTVQPMLTFFMGRATRPLESLAVFPVVHALSFLFRALGLSYQEAAIALLGRRNEHAAEVARFGLWLGLASSLGLGLVAFTPLAEVWFVGVSGLTPELAAFALVPARIIVPLPALSVLLSYQRALLVQGRDTRHITVATVVEVVTVALIFTALGWWVELVGVTAAMIAFVVGRLGGNVYLLRPAKAALEGPPAPR